jgi:hypothetical protein
VEVDFFVLLERQKVDTTYFHPMIDASTQLDLYSSNDDDVSYGQSYPPLSEISIISSMSASVSKGTSSQAEADRSSRVLYNRPQCIDSRRAHTIAATRKRKS